MGGSTGTTDSTEGMDAIIGIAIDGNGNAYVTGETLSRDFPVTANAVQRTLAGGACDIFGSPCSDAFMTKITAGGPGVVGRVNVTVTPTDLANGGTFTVSWNGIVAPTNDDWLNLYVLGGLSDSTNRVASWRTTGAAAGTLQLTLPATVASGWYELRLLSPDPTQFGVPGVIARSAPISVGAQVNADVVVTAVTNPPVVAAPGSHFTVTDTTANRGGLPSAGSVTRFYLSLDRARDDGDRALTGSRSVGVLAPNAASTGTTTVTIPTTTPAGTYFLLACADDTSTNVESDESNNCTASAGSASIGAPGLASTTVSNPRAAARVGTSFTVSESTANLGSVASTASVTRYYLSVDRVKGAGDRLLIGSRSVGVLAPNAASTGTTTVTIPSATPLGTYFLLACADDTAKNVESDESNNCTVSAGSVSIANPDLAATAVSNPPASARVGASFTVSDSTMNRGIVASATSVTRYYLSVDRVRSTGDRLLPGSRNVPLLAPNGVSSGAATVTIPTATPFGSYFLLACADDTKVRIESDETNNCVASASAMNVGP